MKSFEHASHSEPEETVSQQVHLKEGIPAIIACVGTHEQFGENPGAEEIAFRDRTPEIPETYNVDYTKSPEGRSYVISPISSSDKFSRGYGDCTGLVAAGRDKKNTENVSFLSHQDPKYFLSSEVNQNNFVSDLEQRLSELKQRCNEGTIDAVIVGGSYREEYPEFQKNYPDSIALLSKEVEKILGFEPMVMTGPKTQKKGGMESVFYQNKERRLYISRPEVGNASTESFVSSAVKDQEKKW